MDNVYNINWRTFIIINLPVFLRKIRSIKLLEVFFKPVVLLHLEFLEFRRQALYKVNHNSQICYLQAVLNDSFDNVQRRIIIRNAILREVHRDFRCTGSVMARTFARVKPPSAPVKA